MFTRFGGEGRLLHCGFGKNLFNWLKSGTILGFFFLQYKTKLLFKKKNLSTLKMKISRVSFCCSA